MSSLAKTSLETIFFSCSFICTFIMENGTTKKVKQSHIDDLRHILSGTKARVITAEDEAYSTSISRWSTAAVKPAGVVAIPTTVHEVSLVVKYATEQALDLAIKGGGHSTAGASSTDGGLLLDLHASMRNVTVDSERKLLRVQGGANWGDVDRAAAQYGLATVGGTVADTGVGGLTLGGGYGWLSGQYGLVVDNLVSCTIVVASGEIVTASADENADLFWAVCGAGQNFGVVVEFVFRAFEQGDVWGGMLMFSPKEDVMHRVVEAVNELYTPDQEGRTKIAGRAGGGLGIARPPPAGGEVMLMVPVVYFGTEEEGKKVFSKLFDIGPVASTMAVRVSHAGRFHMLTSTADDAVPSSQPDPCCALRCAPYIDERRSISHANQASIRSRHSPLLRFLHLRKLRPSRQRDPVRSLRSAPSYPELQRQLRQPRHSLQRHDRTNVDGLAE